MHKRNKGTIMLRILVVMALLGVAGCETVAGMGRDITNTADAIGRRF